jgi:hypothetical protein
MKRSHEDDADDRLERTERKIFGARKKISCGIIHEHIERTILPDHSDHFVQRGGIADVAPTGMDSTSGAFAQFLFGRGKNFFTPTADVNHGTEFQKSLGSGFAETSASASNKDAFVEKKIVPEHGSDCKPAERELRLA